MSAPAAATDAAKPKGKSKKKLIIIIVAALLVLGLGGGAAVFMMKKKSADAALAEGEDGEDGSKTAGKGKDENKTPPIFLPLDPFVVNLADKDSDRFAQIGITLEITDAKAGEDLKAYMPAIRNAILMVLSQKKATDLMDRAGKEALAAEVMRESVRPLGIEMAAPEAAATEVKTEGDDEPPVKKKKKKKAVDAGPVRQVHFSSFIIQ